MQMICKKSKKGKHQRKCDTKLIVFTHQQNVKVSFRVNTMATYHKYK